MCTHWGRCIWPVLLSPLDILNQIMHFDVYLLFILYIIDLNCTAYVAQEIFAEDTKMFTLTAGILRDFYTLTLEQIICQNTAERV